MLAALVALPGLGIGAAPHPTATTVLAIQQSPSITNVSTFTVSVQVADPSAVTFAYFTFCQQTHSQCYQPIAMTLHNTNWFVGTTLPMTSYPGMTDGVQAGYNITLEFSDNTNLTEPSLPNAFSGLSIITSVSGAYEFGLWVHNPAYVLGGTVIDESTGLGIPGATVSLTPGNNSTTTSSSGAFSFPAVGNGSYRVTVTATGYGSKWSSVAVSGGPVFQNFSLSNGGGVGGSGGGGGGGASSLLGGTMLWVLIGGVVIVAASVAAYLLWRARRARGTSPAPSVRARSNDLPEAERADRPSIPG